MFNGPDGMDAYHEATKGQTSHPYSNDLLVPVYNGIAKYTA